MNKLSLELKNIRIKLDLYQEELATKMGVTKEYISTLENGKRKPSYKYLYKLYTLAGFAKIPEKTLNLLANQDSEEKEDVLIENNLTEKETIEIKNLEENSFEKNLFVKKETYLDDIDYLYKIIEDSTINNTQEDVEEIMTSFRGKNLKINDKKLNVIIDAIKYFFLDDLETYEFFIKKASKDEKDSFYENILINEKINISLYKIHKNKDKKQILELLKKLDLLIEKFDINNSNFYYKKNVVNYFLLKTLHKNNTIESYEKCIDFSLNELRKISKNNFENTSNTNFFIGALIRCYSELALIKNDYTFIEKAELLFFSYFLDKIEQKYKKINFCYNISVFIIVKAKLKYSIDKNYSYSEDFNFCRSYYEKIQKPDFYISNKFFDFYKKNNIDLC